MYLRIERIEDVLHRQDDEPRTRVWFRLVNNCRVAITGGTFGVPEGSPEGEAGLIYNITTMPKPQFSEVVMVPLANEQTSPPTKEDAVQVPSGTDFDVHSSERIPPGASLLFSVPLSHLSKRWRLEIPYEFDVPKGRGPRDPSTGGEPYMRPLYSAWDLPDDVRHRLPHE